MNFVKYLLIFVLTVFAALILVAVVPKSGSSYIGASVTTLIYASLVYLIWPIGTAYSEVGFKRLFFVASFGMFLLAFNVLFTGECPANESLPIAANYKSNGIDIIVSLTCMYLGKLPTAILLSAFGGCLIYLGYTKKPNPSFKRDA